MRSATAAGSIPYVLGEVGKSTAVSDECRQAANFMPVPDTLTHMSLAADTRRGAEQYPFLVMALRAGVLNYTAAARFLESETALTGDIGAVATALRRYASELPELETTARDARVTMQSGIEPVEDTPSTEALVRVGSIALGPGSGDSTAILVTGDVDSTVLSGILERLALAEIAVTAAGYVDETIVVVVARSAGANAVRLIEGALETVCEQ